MQVAPQIIVKRLNNGGRPARNHELEQRVKLEVFLHYSGMVLACIRCGYSDIRALSIDHINGDGAQQRRELGGGIGIYRWLQRNDYPAGYQVLCMNCQYLKRCENAEYG